MLHTKFLCSLSMYRDAACYSSGVEDVEIVHTLPSARFSTEFWQYLNTYWVNEEVLWVIIAQLMISSNICIENYSRYVVADLLQQ